MPLCPLQKGEVDGVYQPMEVPFRNDSVPRVCIRFGALLESTRDGLETLNVRRHARGIEVRRTSCRIAPAHGLT
jgi:hypothetical protein